MTGLAVQPPLIVQSDRTLLLEVDNPAYAECRDRLAAFAELTKSPEHFHTYTVTPLSLWNACAAGTTIDFVVDTLQQYARYAPPEKVLTELRSLMQRYGRVRLQPRDGLLVLETDGSDTLAELQQNTRLAPMLGDAAGAGAVVVAPGDRGHLKQELLKAGFPVEDLAGYKDGTPYPVSLTTGPDFNLRDYQQRAIEAFWADGGPRGGSGVLVLPCGAGKTVIGLGALAQASTHTLILCTNISAVRQWTREILARTSVPAEDIGEYSGERKVIRPVTLATYQIMISRGKGRDHYPHLDLFTQHDWGLIIYDEVHLLPAPVFRATAELQSRRRLGLTATLIREDGKEGDVFSLIGPKKFDAPWKELESAGWIAPAECTEVRVPMTAEARGDYAAADARQRYRIAACNPAKLQALGGLLERHAKDHVLVIAQYLDQIAHVGRLAGAPVITGETPTRDRERLYAEFRSGETPVLVVSKVANFAVDLPEANVAIELSGTFGSRQEEAQRLGRVLRPKADGGPAHFYALVSQDTVDQKFADHRQLFLIEQGYRYRIEDFFPA